MPRNPNPLERSFLNIVESVGVNLGCPVRLLRALRALSKLSPSDQEEPRAQLRARSQHLKAVEELLWTVGWKLQDFRRGGSIFGPGNVDWAFGPDYEPVFLEAKFRVSDWARIADRGSFLIEGNGFLSNALRKFPPVPSPPRALHVVGVTLFDNITKEIVSMARDELRAAPQIHAVVFRSLLWMTHVVALTHRPCKRIRDLLTQPVFKDSPSNYVVIHGRAERDQRVAQRPAQVPLESVPGVYCLGVEPSSIPLWIKSRRVTYHANITSYAQDGEPLIEVIPPY